jgi:hypothetical protein
MSQIRAELLLSENVDDFSGTDLMKISEEEVTDALIPFFENRRPLYLIYSVDYEEDNLGYSTLFGNRYIEDPDEIITIIDFVNFIKSVPEDKLLQTLWYFLPSTSQRLDDFPVSPYFSGWSTHITLQDFLGERAITDLTTIVEMDDLETFVLSEDKYVDFILGYFYMGHRRTDFIDGLTDDQAEEILYGIPEETYTDVFAPIIESRVVDKRLRNLLNYYDLSTLPSELQGRYEYCENIDDISELIDYIRNLTEEEYFSPEQFNELNSLVEDLSNLYDELEDTVYSGVAEALEIIDDLHISVPEMLGFADDTLEEFLLTYYTVEHTYEYIFDIYALSHDTGFIERFIDGLVECDLLDRGFSYDHEIRDLKLVDNRVLIATLEEY